MGYDTQVHSCNCTGICREVGGTAIRITIESHRRYSAVIRDSLNSSNQTLVLTKLKHVHYFRNR